MHCHSMPARPSYMKYLRCSTLWKGIQPKTINYGAFHRYQTYQAFGPFPKNPKTPHGCMEHCKRITEESRVSSIHASYLGLVVYIDLSHPLNLYFLQIDKFELRWHRITINPTSQHHPQHLVMGIHSHLSDPLFWNIIILLNIKHLKKRGEDHSMKMILNYNSLRNLHRQIWRRVWSYSNTYWWCS